MASAVLEVEHLPECEDFRGLADCVVVNVAGSQRLLAHSQLIAATSPHLAGLVALAAAAGGDDRDKAGLPALCLLPSDSAAVPSDVQQACGAFGAFLAQAVYRHRQFEWSTIGDVLQLADYFGASGVLQHADAWICEQYRQTGTLQPLRVCQALELAARHRLSAAMAIMLPWAVQCKARGSRCSSVWYDGKQVCERLAAALDDCQLKALILDAYWWSREVNETCPTCQCRPTDIAASWDTRMEWAAPLAAACSGGPQPSNASLDRAALHYAHLLHHVRWGGTPSLHAAAAVAAPGGLP